MTTKELINSEIEKLSEDELKKVYGVVKNLAESKASEQRPGFMSRLKRIQIDAPEDFASNLDLYVSGEKSQTERFPSTGGRRGITSAEMK